MEEKLEIEKEKNKDKNKINQARMTNVQEEEEEEEEEETMQRNDRAKRMIVKFYRTFQCLKGLGVPVPTYL